MHDSMRPTSVPRSRELRIKVYCSYIKHFMPCSLVRPMLLRQPYSQTFSLMLVVVLTNSKKKDRVNAIKPTTSTMTLKTVIAALRAAFSTSRSNSSVELSLKNDLIPFAI